MNEKKSACIEEIIQVLRKHGFTLSHEDSQGAFVLDPVGANDSAEYNENWLLEAAKTELS